MQAKSFSKTILQKSRGLGCEGGWFREDCRKRGYGENSGEKKVWLNACIKTPLLLKEKDQRLRPSLNAKLHLLKLNLAHIMACFLAPSKSTVHSLSLVLSPMQSPLSSSILKPLFLSFLFHQYPKRKLELEQQCSPISFFFSLSLPSLCCHFLCVQALAT